MSRGRFHAAGARALIICFVVGAVSCPSRGRHKPPALPIIASEMVLVPAGEFVMGKDVEDGPAADHSPAHRVRMDAFHLDKFEVTNAEYLEYCERTGARLPEFWGMEAFRSGPDFPNHPVVGVSWGEARRYAEWAGKRLPSEAEWEYAARGGLVGADYPHGDLLDETAANYWLWPELRSTANGLMPVGRYSANGYGLHDMAGNVAEWVADAYDAGYYERSPAENPPGPEGEKFRVFRGGGWHSGPGCIRVHFRNALPDNWRDFNVGFRCAKDVE
jgi:formylglycine-generating enzyme required for sulfatase activity